MKRLFHRSAGILAAGLTAMIVCSSAGASELRPMNLAATTFLDGGGAPPGAIWMTYLQFIQGKSLVDNNGKVVPGQAKMNIMADLNQVFWLTPVKFAGANLGLNAIVPVSATSVRGTVPYGFPPPALSADLGGVGDPTIGAALQWNNTKIGPVPFFHRLEMDVFLPWGKYDPHVMINPGMNYTTVELYYAFTTFLSPKIETSWRLHYGVNGENKDVEVAPGGPVTIKPGRYFHVNGAASYQVTNQWRAGVAYYYLQQLSDNELNGVTQPGTKERAMGAGPGVAYVTKDLLFMFSRTTDFDVRNRFKGATTTLQLIHEF